MSNDPKATDQGAQELLKQHDESVKLAVQTCKERLEELTGRKIMIAWIGVGPDQKSQCEMTVPVGISMNDMIRMTKELTMAIMDLQMNISARSAVISASRTAGGIITP